MSDNPTARKLLKSELEEIEQLKADFVSSLISRNFRYSHIQHISYTMDNAIEHIKKRKL